jgi:hypothetical protein
MTLVVITTLIVWLLIGAANMLKSSQSGGGEYNSARELRGGESGNIGEQMKMWGIRVATHLMGTIFLKNFFLTFIFIVPFFLLIFAIMYAQFYDRGVIIQRDVEYSKRIMETNHNFMFLVITTLVVFAILWLLLVYFKEMIDLMEGIAPSK